MPELPEVETIVKQLRSSIVNRKILKINIKDSKVVNLNKKQLLNCPIKSVTRRGKYIVMQVGGKYILTHLRMTGHFHILKKQEQLPKFTACSIHLDDGTIFTHNTIRRLGSMKQVSPEEIDELHNRLGPEPLEPSFTLQLFQSILKKKSKSNIKTTIMDPYNLVGVGNIYAQEALYHSKINPNRTSGSLTKKETKDLYNNIKTILRKAIDFQGTTIINYKNLGGKGDFQDFLVVYSKKICPKGHFLENIKIGGRGTRYCRFCQK